MCIRDSSGPVRVWHRSPKAWVRARSVSSWAWFVIGLSAVRYASASLSEPHFTAVDEPTPRGSKPTMSYTSRTEAPNAVDAWSTRSMPDAPGPPGLISSEPSRWSCFVAADLLMARSIDPAVGLAQSRGAFTLAQSNVSHFDQPTTCW